MPTNVTAIPPIPLSVHAVHQTPTTPNLTTMMSPMAPPKTTEVPPAAASPKLAARKEKPTPSKAREDPIAASVMQQSTVANKHAQQQAVQENEQFASLWLRSALEPAANMQVKIEQQEVYKLYITASSKIGRRGVCSPMHFPRIVRNVFGGSVGPTAQKCTKNGIEVTEYHYEGLQIRARPLTVVQKEPDTKIQPTQVQIADPALTGQSCSSPQPTATTSTGSILYKNVMIHQNTGQAAADSNKSVIVVTSQATTGQQQSIIVQQSGIVGQTQQQQTSSLIKSLLANKVTTTNDGSSNPTVITSTSAATNVSNCLIASNVNQLHQVTPREQKNK
jgi:AT-rich interactive domain-containing protein 2